jgi:tetratricopeptide (TPR) repeat protein
MRVPATSPRFVILAAIAAMIVAGAIAYRPSAAASALRLPTDDDEVLERLPSGAGDPRARRAAELRRSLAARPEDLDAAMALARLDIQEARARSDPRFLGYAQAALAPWWSLSEPPTPVLVLRATIKQSLHDFEGALADLDRAVALAPDDGQAWITRSVVLTVRGRYDEARRSCEPLRDLATPMTLAACTGAVDAVTGHAADAYARILGTPTLPGERAWAQSTLGEVAVRLGRDADAERHFVTALAIDPSDGYATGAYADLLLDAGRAPEVVTMLAGRTDNDGLLLRLALAEAATGAPQAAAHAGAVAARFEAAHLRGDRLHLREESRFELGLRHDPARALALAKENFAVQKEPWDVRVYLEAALAAGEHDAAVPALELLAAHHLEDPCIASLATKLRTPVSP